MRARTATGLFLCLIVLLGAAPAQACREVLGVSVDCTPTPTPTPKPKTKRDRASAEQTGSPAGTMFRYAERARASAGLGELTYDSVAAGVAREHAARMAKAGKIFHNRALTSAATRRRLGYPDLLMENVGFGPSARKIHRAFMNSASHRRVLLHRGARAAGMGVVRRDGKLWVVQVFMDRNAPGGRSKAPAAASGSRRERAGRDAPPPSDSPDTIFGIDAPAVGFGSTPAPASRVAGWALILTAGVLSLAATWLALRRRAV